MLVYLDQQVALSSNFYQRYLAIKVIDCHHVESLMWPVSILQTRNEYFNNQFIKHTSYKTKSKIVQISSFRYF